MHFVERQAQGYVIVFDLTRKETFDNVPKWINTLMMHALMENPPILILGNKKDLDEQS
jgi:Ras-related protein Rab-12